LLILRRSNCINTASGIVTLSKWPSGAQVEKELLRSSFSTCAPNSHLLRVTIPDAVLIQFDLLRMSKILPETCTVLSQPVHRTVTYWELRYQMLYWYNLTSWGWARYCSKHVHVVDCNKCIKIYASSWSLAKLWPQWKYPLVRYGKLRPVQVMKACWGVELSIWALSVNYWSASQSGRITRREKAHHVHWLGGLVGLDTVRTFWKTRIYPTRPRLLAPSLLTIPTTIFWFISKHIRWGLQIM